MLGGQLNVKELSLPLGHPADETSHPAITLLQSKMQGNWTPKQGYHEMMFPLQGKEGLHQLARAQLTRRPASPKTYLKCRLPMSAKHSGMTSLECPGPGDQGQVSGSVKNPAHDLIPCLAWVSCKRWGTTPKPVLGCPHL